MAIIPILQALTPFVPLITKAVKGSKDVKKAVKETTFDTEISQVGYLGALTLIIQEVQSCGPILTTDSLSCVTPETWGLLLISAFYGAKRYIEKYHVS